MYNNNVNFMKKELNLSSLNIELLDFRIKEVAKIKGVTSKSIADKVKVDKSYISRINSGKVKPSLDLLQKIADALDVPVHQLIVTPDGYAHFEVDKQWLGIRKI